MKIIILTGEIKSGKTHWLSKITRDSNFIGGVLTPDKNEIRMLYDIANQNWHNFEAKVDSDKELVQIGRFKFELESFQIAKGIIQDSLMNKKLTIVDEFGPLEMRGEGFADVINKILQDENHQKDQMLVLVVRNNILSDFLQKYNSINKILKIEEIRDRGLEVLIDDLED